MYASDNSGAGAVDNTGLPANSITPPSLVDTASNPNQASSSWVNSVENAFGSVESAVSSGVSSAASTLKSLPSTVISDVEIGVEKSYSVVKSVGSDAAAGVSSVVDFGLSRIMLVVLGVGVVLYFIASTGAVKVNAVV